MPSMYPSLTMPIYTVVREEAHGRVLFVAYPEHNPSLRFVGASEEEAAERLENFMLKLAWYNEFGFA